MFGLHHYETFLLTAILLNLTPGNDTVFILTRSITGGKKAGLMSVAGIAAGSLVHTLLAATGLSLIIASAPVLFTVIQYAGIAYLVYIGVTMMFNRKTGIPNLENEGLRQNNSIVFRQALLTNVLNPKVALFFLAFLPQFIIPGYPLKFLSFLMLGLSFTVTGTLWCLVLAVFSAKLAGGFRNNPTYSRWLNRLGGITLVSLGIYMAVKSGK